MLTALHTLGWMLALVLATIPAYWFLVHPRAEYWRSKQGARFRILGPMWISMWVLAGLITWPWRHVLLYDTPWSWLAAGFFVATGLYLYARARATFSMAQLAGRPEVAGGNSEQRLVTSGIHARVRHPVYLGHLCELIGWSLGTGMVVMWALAAFAVLTGALMIRMEDDELERRFGPPYRQYRQRTPAVLPRIFSPMDRALAADASEIDERSQDLLPKSPLRRGTS